MPEPFVAALEPVVKQRIPPPERSLLLANDLRALAAAAQPPELVAAAFSRPAVPPRVRRWPATR